ncbi:MAG TPA: ABC transporter transmembrane domain-containing protein [Candidatus Cybelea sp.]|nr:ABC transporter transmembrane domain-containing protein [Candidatus Cybelea sp.]
MEKSLFKFILKYSLRQQVFLTLLSIASFVPYYYQLSVPKTIVNQGITGKGVTFPVTLLGFQLSHEMYLFALTLLFLFLVIVQQIFKYSINVYQGISGERMLRRLRYELYGRVLRFPLPVFRRMSTGEIIPMITAETENLGGFIATAIAVPVFNGGMFLVSLGFLFVQNWGIAVAALSIYPFQLYVIPRMQRRVNQLGKERVRSARKLSDRIGESIAGVEEVHAHNISNRLLAEFSYRLGDIYWLRYDIFQRKFMIKFLNNFLQQAGPFLFYLIGGYLAIKGSLDVGTIVAAVAAQKDMGAPLKELLNYYQLQQDARIKYEQVVQQFDPDGIRTADYQLIEPEKIEPLKGELQAVNLGLADDQGNPIVEGISFTVSLEKHVAIVGPGGSGREDLAMLIARLMDPTKGRITIGGVDLATLPEAITGRRIAYVSQSPYIFAANIETNLFLGLRHRPRTTLEYAGEDAKAYHVRLRESLASGNTTDDPSADWTDYEAAGVADMAGLRKEGLRVLKLVELYDDGFQLGLRSTIDAARETALVDGLLKARISLREKLSGNGQGQLIEGWDRTKYNRNASVAENLMFGSPVGADGLNLERLAEHPYVQAVLEKVGLKDAFLASGYEVAQTMVELFADLPPDHEFFQQFSFISSDDLPDMQDLLSRANKERLNELADADRLRLMSLPFKVIPARHRLGAVDDALMARVLEAREVFMRDLPPELTNKVEFFDPAKYTAAANLQDNILFGKIVYGQAKAAEMVIAMLGEAIDQHGIRDAVAEVGLGFECGIAGGRLSAAQRQKLAIARCIVKHPDLLVMSDATAPLDAASQARVLDAILDEFKGRGLVCSLHRPAAARRFDHIMVMRQGRIVEQGNFAELDKDGTLFHELLQHD